MPHRTTREIVRNAREAGTVVPAFNVPYLPMMTPIVAALKELHSFGLVQVARLEWVKFQAGSLAAIRDEYERLRDDRCTRLHLDHVPVIDEDGLRVDYAADMAEALRLGYESVMVDGSRLALDENIAATREVVEMARNTGAAVEGELGAVLGHETGPLPPYEELFASGKGFTDPQEARRFVEETGVDWLSVAAGNIHGAISETKRHKAKPRARLSLPRIEAIAEATGVPLVLHGGTGIETDCVRDAIRCGIAKINIATAIRQPYEAALGESAEAAQAAVHQTMRTILRDELHIEGSVDVVNPD